MFFKEFTVYGAVVLVVCSKASDVRIADALFGKVLQETGRGLTLRKVKLIILHENSGII